MNRHPSERSEPLVPQWQSLSLKIASLQCLIWGAFILLLPERSGIIYGLDHAPYELFLWQGTGLVIFLFGVGYGIAATNPVQHWAVILIGLLSKMLGPVGMLWSVWSGQIPARVLVLIPMNDVVWWAPFSIILFHVYTRSKRTLS